MLTPTGTNLVDWDLHLYNADGTTTGSQGVTGAISGTLAGFDFIIVDVVIFMQDNKGVVLVDNNGNVVQFISFGTTITATEGPADGLTSENIGNQTLITHSLQLKGTGSSYPDFTWTTDYLSTCGMVNPDQILQDPSSLLPIELAYFKAANRNEMVYLQWGTLTELNNDYFLLERSTDGRDWNILAHIAGQAVSNELLTYEFIDKQPLTGTSYYRLSQFDLDGSIEIFDIIAIQTLIESDDIKIFPNPGSSVLNVRLSVNDSYDDLKIIVRNLYGKAMSVNQLSEGVLDVSQLEPGTYYIHVISGANQYQKVFTKF
jgi:Secretion system C-terminal sorting domain